MCPRATGNRRFVCHVLLLETADGLVLVDSGFGHADIANPARIGPGRGYLRPAFDEAETALNHVRALGHDRSDVRHIVLTHLDVDHVGAISDFPTATIHVMSAEHRSAMSPQIGAEKRRYRPEQWDHDPRWQLHDARTGGDEWEGFASVRPIEVLGSDVAMVPLPGHTSGHAGVAVRDGDRWLLHAGDAYFHANQMPSSVRPASKAPLGIRLLERSVAVDNKKRQANLERIQQLAASGEGRVTVFCAHDPSEFETLAGTDN